MSIATCKAYWLTGGIGAAVLAVSAASIGAGAVEAPRPFVWLDVAAIYFVAALPLAATISLAAVGKVSWRVPTLAVTAMEVVAVIVVPEIYVRARLKHDLDEAVVLVEQSRWGEAGALVEEGLRLRPRLVYHGVAVRALAKMIEARVAELEQEVMERLPAGAYKAAIVTRTGKLAMLGREEEALSILNSSPAVAITAEASVLQGTIFETRGQWRVAEEWYTRGKAAWAEQANTDERTAGLARAIRGVAFCKRKQGQLKDAEAAWQELVALSSSAETHFLLAQFYQDTQQAAKAKVHAQQAVALAPDRYTHASGELIDALVTSHFGCLGAFAADKNPSTPFAGELLDETRETK